MDEVVVKPHNLTGNLADDLSSAPPAPINFKDVGIPGFEGERREKIKYNSTRSLILSTLLLPIMPLDIEGMYKQISGYNRRLKESRKLSKQLQTVNSMINFYGSQFLQDQYSLSSDEIYAFVLACVENTPAMESDFLRGSHPIVLAAMNDYSNSRTP